MTRKANVLTEKKIHKGYFSVSTFEIEASSLNPKKKLLHFERDVMLCNDSVMVLIYAKSIDSFVFCQQFRPGILLNKGKDDPFVIGCVSGTIDQEKTSEEIACMEAWEEAGVKLDHIEKIATAYKSPGLMTEKMHFFYGETPSTPKSGYFGVEGEDILTHVLPRDMVFSMMDEQKISDLGTLFLLNWFRAKS